MKQCPSCNRIYDDDSLRFCLDDGSTLTAPYDAAATLIGRPTRRTDARTEILPDSVATAEIPGRSRTPWTHYVIIALLALIAGGGVVWLLRGRGETTANSTPINTASTESKPSPAGSSTPSPSPPATTPTVKAPATQPGPDRLFIILGSFTKDLRAAAEDKLRTVKAAGFDASIIDTDDYPGLSPGYWAVVVGPVDQKAAPGILSDVRSKFPDAYAKPGW